MKLLFSSFMTSAEQDAALAKVIGKEIRETKVAYIENAHDVYDDEESLRQGREALRDKGYDVELVDLREWKEDRIGLEAKLASKDMFLLAGGNPYYLRGLMRETGADEIIVALVKQGKVYSGASAGAVVAGPTLQFFDELDDPNEAKEVIWEGLNLTQIVIVPHIDNADFGNALREANLQLIKAGYTTQTLTDAQALLIDGDQQWLI